MALEVSKNRLQCYIFLWKEVETDLKVWYDIVVSQNLTVSHKTAGLSHDPCELSPSCTWAKNITFWLIKVIFFCNVCAVSCIKATILETKLQICGLLGVQGISFQCFRLVEFNLAFLNVTSEIYKPYFFSCGHNSFERIERRFLFCQN